MIKLLVPSILNFKKSLLDFKNSIKEPKSTTVSGELPLVKGHICFDNGHAYFIVTKIDDGRSVYGHYKCSRCGHEDHYQYDYA